MARKVKIVLDDGVDKREVGYYSTPAFIAKYLTSAMIEISPNGKYVLDPAVGKEELIQDFFSLGKIIDSFDIIKYCDHYKSNFSLQNFIDYYAEIVENMFFTHNINSKYDYIIANPPYNCHEVSYIRDNKKWLNELFPVGAYNMYSMFLSAMINMAKEGCVIGVIISDSFLTANMHSKLRTQIFSTCSIHQIILCPTDLFWSQKADVRTCIMILQKGKKYQGKVKISNRPKDINELKKVLSSKRFKEVDVEAIRLGKSNSMNKILIDVDGSIVNLFYKLPSLGELYKCVTCISTGNDEKYLSKEKKAGYSVPFYKNPAKRKFKTEADAYLIDNYLEESHRVKDFMVRNKTLLANEGIVCSSMGLPFSAAYLPSTGVTGVNPTIYPPSSEINWLISYLNSSLVTYLVRGVLIRSNMVTSGYVSNIPILNFTSEEKHALEEISINVRNGKEKVNSAINEIDDIIFSKGLLPQTVIRQIQLFSEDISRNV